MSVDIPKSLAELEDKVRAYVESHIYSGYSHPFKFEALEAPDFNTRTINPRCKFVTLKDYIDEELEGDQSWEAGLRNIGAEYGVYLALPPAYFTK